MCSRCWVALTAIGTSTLKVVGILVAIKATVNRNVNSHYGRILVALKAMLSTPIVDGRHSVFQVLGSSGSYRNVNS